MPNNPQATLHNSLTRLVFKVPYGAVRRRCGICHYTHKNVGITIIINITDNWTTVHSPTSWITEISSMSTIRTRSTPQNTKVFRVQNIQASGLLQRHNNLKQSIIINVSHLSLTSVTDTINLDTLDRLARSPIQNSHPSRSRRRLHLTPAMNNLFPRITRPNIGNKKRLATPSNRTSPFLSKQDRISRLDFRNNRE